jgi:hypothetical protein
MKRLMLALAFLLVVASAVTAFNAMRHATAESTLSPATVPAKIAICRVPLHHSLDGTFSPLFCSGGELNRDAWTFIAADHPEVMRLGPDASREDVTAAIEHDLQDSESGARECSAALLAAAYYGWTFRIDSSAGLPLDCPIVR